jgi:hypothetical protein
MVHMALTLFKSAVLRIHDILGWIRIWIRGSMPLTNRSGSGSCYFRHWPSQDAIKKTNFLKSFFVFYFLKVRTCTCTSFSKIKSQKKSQSSRNQDFPYFFCLVIEGSIPLTDGSGSGSRRPKGMDPVDPDPDSDPDPQHCKSVEL